MTLATAGPDGRASARIVLLRGLDAQGLRFYTNYESRKGVELAANGWAAALLYWDTLERQVRVEGRVERLSRAESEAYFASRPRGSRIAAWASQQSRPLPSRAALEAAYAAADARFPAEDVPLPPHWGGFRLVPEVYEFWRSGAHRLHDRARYTRQPDGTWVCERLAP